MRMRMRRRCGGCGWVVRVWANAGVLAATVVCQLGADSAGAADVEWSLASRRDSELVELVQTLDASPAPKVDAAATDVDAVCLVRECILQLEESRYRITENVVYRVLNAEGARVGGQRFAYTSRCRVDEARAWIVRGDQVIRCPAGAVSVAKGNGSRPTEVIVAIPGILDGDVVGWSCRRSADWTYAGNTIVLQDPEPTRLYRLRLLTDGLVAYRVMGRNLDPGTFDVNVLERRNGTEVHTVAEFRDLVEVADGPYAPPPYATAPSVSINWRGYLDTARGIWFYTASWNEAAVWMSEVIDGAVAVNSDVRRKAEEITAGIRGEKDRLVALHDFVRTQIVKLDPGESPDEERRADEVLAARTASPVEAGALLCALAQAVGVPVRPVFARSLDLGPIDNGNPGMHQFSDVLVEYLAEPGCFAAPSRRNCPLGSLPDDLTGATAMVLADDLAAKERDALGKVFSSSDKDAILIARYHDYVGRLPWQTTFTLPGNPTEVRGALVETMTVGAGSDTVAITLVGKGRDGFLADAPQTDEPADLLSHYCEQRLPAARVVRAHPRALDGTLEGVLSLDLGQQVGDTWAIPSESVFGAPFLDGLELPASEPFHIDATRDYKRVFRMKLPEGWRLAVTPPALNVTHPQFVVSARLGVMNGELIAIREMRLRRGTALRTALSALDDAVGRVRAFEQTTLLLVKDTAAQAKP